ncbi:MAG: hypothetical protein COA99_05345 [Moraxellaceae bacterium]|nr:MAG: hypothetical protein COA99_05345 [Moraxellaceae bacterium]
MRHFLTFIFSVTTLFLLSNVSGCSYNKVEVWQRGDLAKSVMLRDASSTHAALEQHTYSAKEATAGGYTTGAGGCGCN